MLESVIGTLTMYFQNMMTTNALGFLVGMIAGSSVLPIPSESILVSMGLMGFDPLYAAVLGGVGSTVGAAIAYYIGKLYGRALVEKVGKYFFLTQRGVKTMDKWAERFGPVTVLTSRLVPIVPHKVFSIFAGITKIDFKNFIILTLVGSVPRSFILVYFGNYVGALNSMWAVVGSIILIFVLPLIFVKVVDLTKS